MDVHLTDSIAIVRILWDRGEARSRSRRQRSFPTAASANDRRHDSHSIGEARRVAHRPNGRQFVYRALVTEGDVPCRWCAN